MLSITVVKKFYSTGPRLKMIASDASLICPSVKYREQSLKHWLPDNV